MKDEELPKLRKQFYEILEEKEPFGNEYHDELFAWMIVKIEEYADLQVKEHNQRLSEIIESMHKPEYAAFFIGDDQFDGYELAERLKKGKV